MAIKTWAYGSTVRRTGSSSTTYGRIDIAWSGLPENIRIKRIYWQWDVDRQNGGVYARWYYGTSGDTIAGSTGVSGAGFQFDVTSKVTISGTSGTAWVYLGAQNGWADYSNISFSIEFDYLQSSFTLSTTNIEAGKAITANIAIQDSTASHKATWQFGTRTSVVTTGAGVKANSFTVPLAWLDQIPNATSGLASCTLETINSAGTSVGSQTLYFNILAPASVVPSITSLTASRVDNNVPSAWAAYVQGQSGVKITGAASGAYGSTITGWVIAGDGKRGTASTLTVDRISGSGTLTFTATVTDSRGRSAKKTVSITVIAWSSPVIKTLAVTRCYANGTVDPTGTSLLVTVDGSVSSVGDKNTASMTISYRLKGTSDWTAAGSDAMTSGSWVIASREASLTSAYEVMAVLSDTFASATQTTVCPTAECFMDKMPGRKRLGIGAYCPGDNMFYIAGDMAPRWGDKSLVPAPRNLLDNSDFTHPVNQRGQTSYTGSDYGIDRWQGRVINQTVTPRSIDVTVTSTGTSYAGIKQKVLDIAKYAGKTLTFACNLWSSVKADLRIVDASDNNIAYVTVEAGQRTIVLTFTVPTDATPDNCIPTILLRTVASGDYMRLYWAALYEGSYTADTLPEYVPKGYAAELVECMRYYQKVYRVYGTSAGNVSREAVMLSPPMRIAPTVTQLREWEGSSGAGYEVQGSSSTYIDVQYTGWGNVTLALSADL